MRHFKSQNSKLVIILFGPPGSGKGTQAGLLAEKFNLAYLETSKILEREFQEKKTPFLEIEGKKYYFSKEKKLWLEGKLCSPPFVTFLIKKEIERVFKEGKNLILAGSPRTLYEGKAIMPVLMKFYGRENIKVILLLLSAKESIFRNSHRRICQLFRHPIIYNKETKNLTSCPLDGSKLIKREGLDDPETIKVRLREYRERTFPLIDYFEKQGLKIKKVNGEQSVAEVYKAILKAIK